MSRHLRGSRLIYQVYTLNLLITAAATGMFGAYIYYNTFTSTREQLFENSRRNLQEVVGEMESAFRRIETQCASLSMNGTFRSGVSGLYHKSAGEIYGDYLKLDRLCADLENVDDLYDIAVVFEVPHRMMNNRDRFYYDDMQFGDRVLGRSSFWLWNHDGLKGMPLYGMRVHTEGENLYLLFGVRERVYQEWLGRLRLYGEGDSFIGTADKDAVGDAWKKEIFGRIADSKAQKGDFILNYGGEKYFVLYGCAGGGPFFAVSAFPTSTIERNAEDSVKGMFFILLPIFLLVLLASYAASWYLTRHLRRLSVEMNRMYPTGNDREVRKKGWDEIDILEQSFREMQKRINRAMEEVREAEKKQRFAQLSLLQGQINPHFLYNTLDSINWLAIKTGAPKISFIVKNMSDYFRMGLNAGRQVSTLQQEVCHIMSYFNIQKFRFEDKIHLYIDIPKEMMELPMIVLTLQPAVENAILHGILSEEDREGKITISAETVEETAFVYVADNGVGMDEEEVGCLNRRIKRGENGESGSSGYGLYNVNQRIRYFFGEKYGLDIISKKGEGTTCILTLPVHADLLEDVTVQP